MAPLSAPTGERRSTGCSHVLRLLEAADAEYGVCVGSRWCNRQFLGSAALTKMAYILWRLNDSGGVTRISFELNASAASYQEQAAESSCGTCYCGWLVLLVSGRVPSATSKLRSSCSIASG